MQISPYEKFSIENRSEDGSCPMTGPAGLVAGTASAPGDLPWVNIVQREQLLATQFRHDNTIEPKAPRSTDSVTVRATSGPTLALSQARLHYTTDGSAPTDRSAAVELHRTIEWTPATGFLDAWTGTVPAHPDDTTVRYRIAGTADGGETVWAHDGSGFWYEAETDLLTTFAYRVGQARNHLPDWLRDGVVYQVFVDRFRGDNGPLTGGDPDTKHGGTLAGVEAALPYLEELGIDVIWVSPIGPSPTYHRYDQVDFFAVADEVGGIGAARSLVEAAHSRGMRLILDYVPSHCSHLMDAFRSAQTDPDSPTRHWFSFTAWPDQYRNFLGKVPSLPSFNGNSTGVRDHLNASVAFWLADVGFDGLRLDHAIAHGSDFWVQFTEHALAAKPDAALFGEVTDTPDMLRNFKGQLQAVLDFQLANAIRSTLGTGDWSLDRFDTILRSYHAYMDDGPDRVSFLDNHDMDRFLHLAGGDTRRLRTAILLLLCLPHPPVIYYGTEIGMSHDIGMGEAGFGGDALVRADMVWEPDRWDHELLAFVKQAIALRRTRPALRRGTVRPQPIDRAAGIYRFDLQLGDERLQVGLNLGPHPHRVADDARVLLATDGHTGSGPIDLPPFGGAVWVADHPGPDQSARPDHESSPLTNYQPLGEKP